MSVNQPALGITYQSVLGTVINSMRAHSNDRQIKQADIAKALGITVSTWSRIERGESSITLEQLLMTAIFLKIPLSELFHAVEKNIDELRIKGINVAISKDALPPEKYVQLSNTQLIGMGFMAAGPIGALGAAALSAYKSLLLSQKS